MNKNKEKLLAKRYSSEKRFQFLGKSAIFMALLFLTFFIFKIFSTGYTAFQKTWLIVPVTFDAETMYLDENPSKEDLEGFPDFIRSISGVEAALMIFEIDENLCRMNFRSKGNIIVNTIAKFFNGGGHAFASGAVLHEPIEIAKSTIINKTKKMIQDQLDA